MKRYFSSLALCLFLTLAGLFALSPYVSAENDLLQNLLNTPAPPPHNPFFVNRARLNTEKFYDKNNPPKDDAPLEELLAYWQAQNGAYSELGYNIKPSEKVLAKILEEVERNPEKIENFLNILPENQETADFVKRLYDSAVGSGDDEKFPKYHKDQIKKWLTYHSNYFSDELLRTAQKVGDANEYVSNQEELLALARVDYDKASPILSRLYNDGNQRVSQVLARWAYYRHALATNSLSDIEKYRSELKAVVEDKSATGGMRDLAFDALVKEKDWDGRDEWYVSLLGDETLHDLRVNGQSYTGLTTILYYAPPEKYVGKMLDLLKNNNPAVRAAAIRNLLFLLNKNNPEVIKALLPWLENPKWANEAGGGERRRLVDALQLFQMPESVPGLIAILNERAEPAKPKTGEFSEMPVPSVPPRMIESTSSTEVYPYRSAAIQALATQKDARAISPLRLILPETKDYERITIVRALLLSGGFSIAEQVEALETIAVNAAKESETMTQAVQKAISEKNTRNKETTDKENEDPESDESENEEAENETAVTTDQIVRMRTETMHHAPPMQQFNLSDIKQLLGMQIIANSEPSEELLAALIERINILDKKDPPLATALRKIIRNWNGAAINSLLLNDLKNGKADADVIVKLLGLRKELREKQSNEIFDARGGSRTAYGISACLLEDNGEYDRILSGDEIETKTALLACARLIRAPLVIEKVAENLQSSNKTLALAAERYLETEDSPEARKIVLSLHPNEAVILGSTVYFAPNNMNFVQPNFMETLFTSVGEQNSGGSFYYYANFSEEARKSEKNLRKEVKENAELTGIYSYDGNYIRVYKDAAVFSWDDGAARYRERALEKEEFNNFKSFLASRRVDELPPFLSFCEGCQSKQILMIGKNGGRRVYLKSDKTPEIFAELEKMLGEFRLPPAKLRYRLEKNLAGLEILFADENLHAQTIWKNGSDLRILIDDQFQRKQIDAELEKLDEADDEDAEDADYEKIESEREKRREQRKFDSFSWRKYNDGKLDGFIAQPSAAEFVNARDNSAVKADEEKWKARTASIEIRADGEGLYKLTRGQTVKIREGFYYSPLITPDNRWAIATKHDEESLLMRVNLTTGKEYKINVGEFPTVEPVAFVSSNNKVLVFAGFYSDEHVERPNRNGKYFFLDANTGTVQPAKGEFRPLDQQTFRSLQPTGVADEFWAAVPDARRNQTIFGVYNAKTFTMKPLVKIPQISFDSMAMWFDETERKIYFVYKGHLLRLSVPK